MAGDYLLEKARRIRRILTAWSLVLVAAFLGGMPGFGPVLGTVVALGALIYAFKPLSYGHWIQATLVAWLSLGLLVGLPLMFADRVEVPVSWFQDKSSSVVPSEAEAARTKSARRRESTTARRFQPPSSKEDPVAASRSSARRIDSKSPPNESLEAFVRRYLRTFEEQRIEDLFGCYLETVTFNGQTEEKINLKPLLRKFWSANAGEITAVDIDVRHRLGKRAVVFVNEEITGGGRRERILKVIFFHDHWVVLSDEINPSNERDEKNLKSKQPVEEQLKEIVLDTRRAEVRRDLEGAMRGYADKVEYFGNTRTFGEVRDDKAEYFKRWPVLEETILKPVHVYFLAHGYARVKFRTRFKTRRPDTDEWRSGVIDNEYMLFGDPDGWRIVGQEGAVSEYQSSEDE